MTKAVTKLPPQYEDPDAAVSIALFKARHEIESSPGSFVSGAQILNFQKGWAMPILGIRASTAHWFVRSGDNFAHSLCGLESLLELIHGPGNYHRCGNCVKTMSRLIKQGAM